MIGVRVGVERLVGTGKLKAEPKGALAGNTQRFLTTTTRLDRGVAPMERTQHLPVSLVDGRCD